MEIKNRTSVLIVFILMSIIIGATMIIQTIINVDNQFIFTGVNISFDEGYIIPIGTLMTYLMNLNLIYGGFNGIYTVGLSALKPKDESAKMPKGKKHVLAFMTGVWFILLIIGYVFMIKFKSPTSVYGIHQLLTGFGVSAVVFIFTITSHNITKSVDITDWVNGEIKNKEKIYDDGDTE